MIEPTGPSNRLSRRQRRREIAALTARADALKARLVENDAEVLAHQQHTSELSAKALVQIEEYVDSLAQVYNIDDHHTTEPLDKVYELMVAVRWRGVETAAQADEEMLKEVARRSVGKSDLALLLSSIDQTAFRLYGTMPDAVRDLHGEELVGEIVRRLEGEEFTLTLMRDARWATMRTRWVLLGWRGTDTEAFNAAFIRAAAERVVEIHDAQGQNKSLTDGGFAVRDTILDEKLQRVHPAQRDQMIEAFRLRLEREYEALPSRAARAGDTSVDFTLDGDEVKRLDAIADRWDTSRNGAMERIVRERMMDDIRRDHPGITVTPLPKGTLSEPYSDHALMRRGRDVWDSSYAKGMTDEQLRDGVGALNTGGQFDDGLTLFAAKWAVHAFQRLMTSHTFAAALMCSDVQREVLVGIERQWDAFLVIVPNGMLLASGFEFSRILVATYSFGARMTLLTTGGPSVPVRVTGAIDDEKPTLADLLVSDGGDLQEDQVTRRCLVMAKRLVAGLLLNLQDAGTHKVRKVDARPKSKGREAEPEHRIVTIGEPIEIDCRGAVKEYIEHGTRDSENGHRRHGTPTVQWMVRGHYRMQAHGPKHTLRRKTWIRPHWQGHEAALIQTRAKVTT